MAKEFKPPKGKIKVPPKVEEDDETSALQWINQNIWKKAKKVLVHFSIRLIYSPLITA